MKKIYAFLAMLLFGTAVVHAQLIYSNGPIVNGPGQGFGGADVSFTHDGLTNYGFNTSFGNYVMAEDFIVPAGQTWNIDSLVFFGYQTNPDTAGSTISTFTGLYYEIYDGDPSVPATMSLYGDVTTSNVLSNSYWSGIYRTTTTVRMNKQRAVMKLVGSAALGSLSLPGGTGGATYWIGWAFEGSVASGPWTVPITTAQLSTGNAQQFIASSGTWKPVIDSTSATAMYPQGMPFEIYGDIVLGINDHENNALGISEIYPLPAKEEINFTINTDKSSMVTVTVNDVTGRKAIAEQHDINSGKNKITINTEGISPGTYFLSITAGESAINKKFTKL